MDPRRLERLLDDVRRGRRPVSEVVEKLRRLPFEDLGFARVDHHRALRQGMPEVIYAPGKTARQLEAIARRLRAAGHAVVITRVEKRTALVLRRKLRGLRYSEDGRIAWLRGKPPGPPVGTVLVVSAGTSDLPVAEEAAVTAVCAGLEVDRLYDVGVAGLHRLLGEGERLGRADVLVVVAGMDGVLPSVVGGWIDRPIVAVPTSVGYGASFDGLAALLTMLNSCAAGVVVVNIDNGFGAAMAAVRIVRSGKEKKR